LRAHQIALNPSTPDQEKIVSNNQSARRINLNQLLAEDYELYIDTSSLMSPDMPAWLGTVLRPSLHKYNAKLFTITEVQKELHRKSPLKNKRQLVVAANRSLEFLNAARLLEVKTCSTGTAFADLNFIHLFTVRRLHTNICLITQDRDLAVDVIHLNRTRAVHSNFKVVAVKISSRYQTEAWIVGKRSTPVVALYPAGLRAAA
jgi:hypothetical protein